MPALALNHYTIRARDLEATRTFYEDIVGLRAGDRRRWRFLAIGSTAGARRSCI